MQVPSQSSNAARKDFFTCILNHTTSHSGGSLTALLRCGRDCCHLVVHACLGGGRTGSSGRCSYLSAAPNSLFLLMKSWNLLRLNALLSFSLSTMDICPGHCSQSFPHHNQKSWYRFVALFVLPSTEGRVVRETLLRYIALSHISFQGVFVCAWMSNSPLRKGGEKEECLMFP